MKPEDIIVQGDIHVDSEGNSHLIQNNKKTGINPSYLLNEAVVDGFTPVTIQKLQVLGYDVTNPQDRKRLVDHHYKDGSMGSRS